MRVCSLSIDLDPIECYFRIHGLGTPPPALDRLIAARAIPRFAEVLDERSIQATFFVVGRQISDPAAIGDLLARLVASGHELANHSHTHPYDLARWGASAVADDLRRADAALRALTGERIVGFRAPGYDLSPAMVEALMELGYSYDSSLFPAPLYYAAKAAVMTAMAVTGRKSGAVLTNPRALLARAEPYRPDARRPWRRGQASIVELPIAVTPGLRIPSIGTSLLCAPRPVRQRILEAMGRRRFFNFELHGLDLIDAVTDDIPPSLVARQPDLRVSLARKRDALEEILEWLRGGGYRFARLRDVAEQVQREGAV